MDDSSPPLEERREPPMTLDFHPADVGVTYLPGGIAVSTRHVVHLDDRLTQASHWETTIATDQGVTVEAHETARTREDAVEQHYRTIRFLVVDGMDPRALGIVVEGITDRKD